MKIDYTVSEINKYDATEKGKPFIEQPDFTFQDARYNQKNINAHKKSADLTSFFG